MKTTVRPSTGTVLVLLGAAVMLTACTRSEWLLSFYYNRLDDRLLDRYTGYADFSPSQKQWAEADVARFHFWHRRVMLPEYAAMLGDAVDRLRDPEATLSRETTDRWSRRFVDSMAAIHQCSPITNAAPFLVTLTDEQVEQIQAQLKEDINEERERYDEWEREDTIQNALKWFSRLGLELTDAQEQRYRDTYDSHQSLWNESIELDARWNSELITLLRIRDKPGIQEAVREHLFNRRGMLRRAHPEPYNANVALWKDYAYELLNNLSDEQRANMIDALQTHRRNLLAISAQAERPENMPADGPCGVSPGAANAAT